MTAGVERLADGLWRWTARHPEWHPRGELGREVASFALRAGRGTLLVDPLLPARPEAVLAALDELVAGEVSILITIPYHTRSAEDLRERYRRAGAAVWGHPAVAKRLEDRSGFRPAAPGSPLPAGVRAYAIGRPRRYERPLYLPSHRALAFGDAVVCVEGRLRVWVQSPVDERRRAWYETRFLPTLRPLLDLDVERVLVTHGPPVLAGGRRALEEALDAPPWYHPPT